MIASQTFILNNMPALRFTLLFCLLPFCFLLHAQPGSLDSSFGKGGIISTNIYPSDDQAFDAVRHPDGRLLIVGSAEKDSIDAFAAVQLLPNGEPDTSFDYDGIALRTFGSNNAIAHSVALYPNGNAIISGTVYYDSDNYDFGLTRILPNGRPDFTFGNNGKIIASYADGSSFADAVLVQDDGKIVVAGSSVLPPFGEPDFALARFLENGQPDSSFGINGNVVHAFSPYPDVIFDAHLLPNGKILVAGVIYYNIFSSDYIIARFLENGQLDLSFGINGYLSIDFGTFNDFCTAIDVQEDGKILLAGYSVFDDYFARISATRLHPDGGIDSSFGIHGKVLKQIGTYSSLGTEIKVQVDSKILISGMTEDTDPRDFFVLRLLPNGLPDPNFATDGMLIQSVGDYDDNSYAILPEPDGPMSLIGKSDNSDESDLAVLRILENGTLDTTFQNQGILKMDLGSSHDECYALLAMLDGTFILGGSALIDPLYSGNVSAALCKYLPDGSLDKSFGNQGILATERTPTWELWANLAQQSDQKILAVGAVGKQPAMMRVWPDGTPDTTFGTNGIVVISSGPTSQFNSVLLQTDGKILAAGHPGQNQTESLFRRFFPDGSTDTSFGTNGVARGPFSQGRTVWGNLEFTPEGKILASGNWTSYDPMIEGGGFLTRLLPNGDVDTSFGQQGYLLFRFAESGFQDIRSFTQLPNGKIQLGAANGDFVVLRFLPDGQIDSSFATNGTLVMDVDQEDNLITDLLVQPDGRVLVSGWNRNDSGNFSKDPFIVVRLEPNGLVDQGFANNGVFQYPGTAAVALDLQKDGNIIAAGNTHNGSNRNNFLLIRLLSGPALGIADQTNVASVLLVYPNPVKETLTLEYELLHHQTIQIKLYDQTGRLAGNLLQNVSRNSGKHQETLQLPVQLSPGFYTLVLETATTKKAIQIMKRE